MLHLNWQGLMVCSAFFIAYGEAAVASEKVLYTFGGEADGATPRAGLLLRDGKLYGTTAAGGQFGHGTVFSLTLDGSKTILHDFKDGADGSAPYGTLIADRAGNMYGTTFYGGHCECGTAYMITPDGKETVLHSFGGKDDGAPPAGEMVMDKGGNLYGVTTSGGTYNGGTIFKLAPDGTESLLYSFGRDSSDGARPWAGLIMDHAGILYGTTHDGGIENKGTVFSFNTKTGKEKIRYAFSGAHHDGFYPEATVVRDDLGNLFGTTAFGGSAGGGVIFKIAPDGTESILRAFKEHDGCSPESPLIFDKAGDLYGTSYECGGDRKFGTVFELSAAGTFTVLHAFSDLSDGSYPVAGLVEDQSGDLFGTTSRGGRVNGVVFEITP